jgi:hypothetical protein
MVRAPGDKRARRCPLLRERVEEFGIGQSGASTVLTTCDKDLSAGQQGCGVITARQLNRNFMEEPLVDL